MPQTAVYRLIRYLEASTWVLGMVLAYPLKIPFFRILIGRMGALRELWARYMLIVYDRT